MKFFLFLVIGVIFLVLIASLIKSLIEENKTLQKQFDDLLKFLDDDKK